MGDGFKYDFRIRAGDSGTIENQDGMAFTYKAGEPPAFVNLTGSVIVFRAEYRGTVLQKTSLDGDIIVDGPAGKVTVPITVADSRLFKPGARADYKIQRRFGNVRRTLLEGFITVVGGVDDGTT
jgi:hypothetical protein